MAAQATHDLAIKTGEYQSNGETKARWLKIGTVFRHDDGGTSIKLDAVPVGLPEWNGWVSVFKRQEQSANGGRPAQQRGNGAGHNGQRPNGGGGYADFEDDIPFDRAYRGAEYII